MEEHQVRRLKIVLIVSSLVCLGLLILAAVDENVLSPWRRHQKDYAQMLAASAGADGRPVVAYTVDLKQNYLETLGRVDRCVSCHAGIDNPAAAGFEQPLSTHPGDVLEHHPPDKFGCTICHQGQGLATELPDAHGQSAHWTEPLLEGDLVYTSCGRCHYENDLYGGQADLYGRPQPVEQVTSGALATHVPGAENIAAGKQLVIERGCLGCHTYRGRGGSLGPDITYVGDKTIHDFDFSHVEGDHTVLVWMTEHFKSPGSVMPGSVMADLGLSHLESQDLAAYMISLKRKSAPAAYTPLPSLVDSTPADGHTLYLMYCSSCHGADGVGAVAAAALDAVAPDLEAIDRPREMLTPSLRNNDTLAVASDDYLRYIIRHGRSGTGMPAWSGDGGLADAEIERLVTAVRDWQAAGPPLESISAGRGNLRFGRALYRSRCTGCHGTDGEGGVGVSLRAPSFLAIASDEFIRDTIVEGRPNTAMPSWKELSADQTSHLIAYIRSWQLEPPSVGEVVARVDEQPAAQGRAPAVLYRSNCANCHGHHGEGALGPSLRTAEFLSVVDDRYLVTAVIEGRPDTAMPAWKHFSTENVADLIRHMRQWYPGPARQLEPLLARGDWDRGRIIFEGTCAGCHGRHAEGGVGPQLANPTFLATVDDSMLRTWISEGKLGTAMVAFGRRAQGMVELSDSQIEDVVTWLRYNEGQPRAVTARPGMGIATVGSEIYADMCSECHGDRGEGRVGSALANPHLLRSANDGFLAATMILGRENTPMVSLAGGQQGMVDLDDEEVSNVVAFLRSWEYEPPGLVVSVQESSEADQRVGRELYRGHCAGCHGADGRDNWAPVLNNPEFLAAASDGFLKATIARGRSGTAMRSFGRGGGGISPLDGEQIENIVSYLRSWAEE